MIKRTVTQVATMIGAHTQMVVGHGEATINGVSIDSRTLEAGQLFVPIIGERLDGHIYAKQAVEAGAAAMLWQAGCELPTDLAEGNCLPIIIVDNTTTSLQALAAAYRQELRVKVIGITGSNGKTTTKDMTAAVLSADFTVQSTIGNYNNEYGLPLTVLALSENTEMAVLEMGMSSFGEIDLLSRIARPDVAIITNIGDAHMEHLGSREGIARAKLEIVNGLQAGGLLLYNGDEPILAHALLGISLPTGVVTTTFGLGTDNTWTAEAIELAADHASFLLAACTEEKVRQRIQLPVSGEHNVSNALAALAVGNHFGIKVDKAAIAIGHLQLTGMRLEPLEAACGARILNDAYNASPSSARAAINLLTALQGFRRKWLVLGDMLELGSEEVAMHAEVGEYAAAGGVDALLTFGPLASHAAAAAKASGSNIAVQHFESKDDMIIWLTDRLEADDLVLVKGSRGMKMEQIALALKAR